jgi:hypothetical protein
MKMFGLDSLEIGLGGTGDEEGLGARAQRVTRWRA